MSKARRVKVRVTYVEEVDVTDAEAFIHGRENLALERARAAGARSGAAKTATFEVVREPDDPPSEAEISRSLVDATDVPAPDAVSMRGKCVWYGPDGRAFSPVLLMKTLRETRGLSLMQAKVIVDSWRTPKS